jgi:outer membrane receptor protein involved in Fe transport
VDSYKIFTRMFFILCLCSASAWAGVDGSISGNVVDSQGIAVGNATVKLVTPQGVLVKEVTTTETGDYLIFPITFGDYQLKLAVPGSAPYQADVHVASGSSTQANIQLSQQGSSKEMVLNVTVKKHVVQTTSSNSSQEVTSSEIDNLPQGSNVSLPHLLAATTPGVIQGPFGQTFIRGNHANIQYQIDGVQLPDSQTNAFGDAFTPRNIDHMEVITGGVPAEYGNRLAAVINIVTKSGPEKPTGEAEVNYGSYDTFSPWAVFGGSTPDGSLHYFFSGQYSTTSRGLDTPDPASDGGSCGVACANQGTGGTNPVHDNSDSNNQFLKLDWFPDNDDKISLVAFNSYEFYQVPNYPSNFLPTDPFFQSGFTDQYGNTNGPGAAPVFNWTPSNTNDSQTQDDAYLELVWKRTLSEKAFLQTALYYKYSEVRVDSDPTNDLASASIVPLANPSSLYENRHVNNLGVKGDFTDRINDRNLFKAGYQAQTAYAAGPVDVVSATNTTQPGSAVTAGSISSVSSADNSTASGNTESAYIQDDFTISKKLVLNAGLRFDAIQYRFLGTSTGTVTDNEDQIEPRIGLNYFIGENTKLHAFYGRLFQPAPLENLRDTFNEINGVANNLNFYDIKAEKDNFYEIGVAQQVGAQVFDLNVYYKSATDMLDDNELLNTSLAEAYNYADGYAYGVEFSVKGKLADNWTDYANYAYEIAKGEGASGGLFAAPGNAAPPPGYGFLDHVQIHTANAGVAYSTDRFLWSTQGLFGSGLRTGPNNSLALPSHFTADTSFGYNFHGDSWITKAKLSFDVVNIFNNVYPITVANGFNASHYEAGREFFVRLSKEI